LPAAVSADSITASLPSSTALATSSTSARVGTGLWIMDSIICVAVITTRCSSRALWMDELLDARQLGVADFHRQVAARDHYRIAGLDDAVQVANGLGTLDLGDDAGLAAGVAQQCASLFDVGASRGNDTAR